MLNISKDSFINFVFIVYDSLINFKRLYYIIPDTENVNFYLKYLKYLYDNVIGYRYIIADIKIIFNAQYF